MPEGIQVGDGQLSHCGCERSSSYIPPLGVGPWKVRCRARTYVRSLKVMSGRVLQA
jgi:hypothetical protein